MTSTGGNDHGWNGMVAGCRSVHVGHIQPEDSCSTSQNSSMHSLSFIFGEGIDASGGVSVAGGGIELFSCDEIVVEWVVSRPFYATEARYRISRPTRHIWTLVHECAAPPPCHP